MNTRDAISPADLDGWEPEPEPEDEPEPEPRRRLTRQEQLQELADHGCDTWEEFRGER